MIKKIQKRIPSRLAPFGVGACLGGALLSAAPNLHAQDASARMTKLEQENEALRKRLEAIETVAQKEGLVPSGGFKPAVRALSEMQISGFVTASYFYDTSRPADGKSNGYLWNTTDNSFTLNKVKLTIASPVAERSGEKWTAGYRASLIWGEDAPVVNTGGEYQGFENLREAYVELNAPLGTGLNIKAGQLISLLNYESGDGGAVNANFSQGYQWYYTGNGPSAGVQVGYTFADWIGVRARVQNGIYAGAIDSNSGKAYMASVDLKPAQDLWVNLIGFQSHESDANSLMGGSVLAGYQVTKALGLGFEFDYFSFDPDPASTKDIWSVGTWVTYDFAPSLGLAFRAEYLDDIDGYGINGVPFRGGQSISSPDADGNLSSFTLTLNYKPVANVKIQPEIRWDHTSYKGGFDGHESRFIVGAGVSYIF